MWRYYQLTLLYIKDILYKLHGYHKTKDYTKYTKDKEKGIKEYYTTKIYQITKKQTKTGGKEQKNYKTARKQLTKWQ